jgi:hypothetical protein
MTQLSRKEKSVKFGGGECCKKQQENTRRRKKFPGSKGGERSFQAARGLGSFIIYEVLLAAFT